MNPFVANPEWGWWIVWYFFLGGIAAGAYFTATLIDLVGRDSDRPLARAGYGIAFPLVAVCGILLILDLNRPERFWHMLVKSQVVHEALTEGWPWSGRGWELLATAPLLKRWSPMSVGSWALLVFGVCTSLSFLGSLWPDGRLSRWLRRGVLGRLLQISGCGVGFFVAAYTGVLLTATNQPLWSDTVLIAPLFLASAASTGIAAMLLFGRWQGASTAAAWRQLERSDLWALLVELTLFVLFLVSLESLRTVVWSTTAGKLLLVAVPLLAILLPLALHLRHGIAAAFFALIGGFLLRYGILATPPELLRREAVTAGFFSPEDGRRPGHPGADAGNRPVVPRSKVFDEP